MNIKEVIARQGGSISFEFFPPKSKEGEDQLFKTIEKLQSLKPTFVSVTYGAGGSTLKNTGHLIERIKKGTSLTPMPHLTCIGQTSEELESILRDYLSMGIENVLALRGDPPGETPKPIPEHSL